MDDKDLKKLWEHPRYNVSEKDVSDSLRTLLYRIDQYEAIFKKETRRTSKWQQVLKYASILLLPIIASALTFYYTDHTHTQKVYVSNVEYTVLPGERKELTLADGTNVYLNSSSVLLAPAEFVNNERSVYLVGEAYFKVAKDSTKPFIVKTPLIDIQALGTEFSVMAYQQTNQVQTTLAEGKVLLSIPGSTTVQPVVLHPSEQSYYAPSLNEIKVSRVNIETYTSWKDGQLIFDETPFGEVINRLRIQFGWKIICDKHLYDTRITAKFIHGESITGILNTLQEVVKFTYKNENNTIYIK